MSERHKERLSDLITELERIARELQAKTLDRDVDWTVRHLAGVKLLLVRATIRAADGELCDLREYHG